MNRFRIAIMGAGLALAGCGPQPAAAPGVVPELAGRTAGPAQSCVELDQMSSLRFVDPRTVIYGSGGTVWISHLASDCPGATNGDVLITHPSGSQYCRGDIVQTVNRFGGIPGPVCVLGDFVPYRR